MNNNTPEKATILVVDDTPANLKLLHEMLQSKGYRVLASPDGKTALNAAAKSMPDLILLDINMPEMNGFEVCERLKANELLKDIPILFISALTETTDKVKAFSVGGVDYVSKPFQFEEVNARVETHLELSRQKRELQESYDKLRELETQRDGLVHMIVHDMRSPLMVTLGNLEMVQDENLSKDAALCVSAALSSTDTVIEMVSTMLDISKMEAGPSALTIFDPFMLE
jgi:PleD family two-component response regulator